MAHTTTVEYPTQMARVPAQARNHTGTVAALSGLSASEFGMGSYRKTVISLSSCALSLTEISGTDAGWGTQLLYTFPAGRIKIHAASGSLIFTTTSLDTSTLNSGKTVNWAVGSAATTATEAGVIGAGATLTQLNIIPGGNGTLPTATSAAQNTAWAVSNSGTAADAITVLTDSTGGTANNTLVTLSTLGDSPANVDALRDDLTATWHVEIENNFADLAAKINEIIYAINGMAGGVVLDGTSTAITVYLNLGVPTADDIDADATLTCTGDILIEWSLVGDY